MAPFEIERKFLVRQLPPALETYPHERLVQGYLVIGEDGREVRLRRTGDRCVQTVKSGEGRVRMEVEIPLDPAQFEALWPAVGYAAIEKTRYAIPFAEHTIEVDVYEGALAGLITAEVEFPTVEASDTFRPPPWMGPEVTNDRRYRNREMARNGLPSAPGHG